MSYSSSTVRIRHKDDLQQDKAAMWMTVVYYVTLLDNYISNVKLVDKMQVAMFVTWLLAWFGLYMTKIFERLFRIILSMPDSWLTCPANAVQMPKNKQGATVNILNARTEHGSITNKLKLFLKFYWEREEHTFDFANLAKLLNCSMLYCCYLLSESPKEITPNEFFNNVNRFLVSCNNEKYIRYTNSNLDDGHQLLMRGVDFNEPSMYDNTNEDLNYVKSIIKEIEARSN